MRIFGFIFGFILAACNPIFTKTSISQTDALSYQEYLTDLEALRSGKRSLESRFGFNKDIGLLHYDFSELSTRIAIVLDGRLKQQYIFIYSEYSEMNQGLAAGAHVENVIGLRGAKISDFYMDLYIQIQESMPYKVQPSYGKVIIVGFGTGAGLANILAADLNINSKISSEKLEVITFAGEPFSRNFKGNFSSTNIVLKSDNLALESKKCCNFMAEKTMILEAGDASQDRISAYKQALNKFISQ